MAHRLLLTLVLLAPWSRALGHGGVAKTISVVSAPADANALYAGTSFGLLRSDDAGATWSWLCEEAIGYGPTLLPSLHVSSSGTLSVATFKGLHRSTDRGCTWSANPELAELGLSSVVGSPLEPGVAYVTTAKYGTTNRLFKSTNDGALFQPTSLAKDKVYFTSVQVAPTSATRVYVAGWWFEPTPTAFLFRSDDGAVSFSEREVTAQLTSPGPFFVLGVSPQSPDLLFVAVDAPGQPAQSHLFRSADGGATLEKVLTSGAAFNSLAFSPDGTSVWVASGQRLYRSADGGRSFSELSAPQQNACVHRRDTALLACGSPSLDGWELGRSLDEGATFQPLFRWKDLTGSAACAPGTPVRDLCEGLLPALVASLPPERVEADSGDDPHAGHGTTGGNGCCGGGSAASALATALAGLALQRGKRSRS